MRGIFTGPADLYDADPVCFRPARKAHIDWVYGLRCAFPDGPVTVAILSLRCLCVVLTLMSGLY
jgi:hypothetical protein